MHWRLPPRVAAAAVLMVALGGCYFSTEPVFQDGDRIPITGEYTCENPLTRQAQTIRITERASGYWPLKNYEYFDQRGRRSIYRRVRGTLFVGQSRDVARNGYNYIYVDAVDRSRLFMLMPSIASKGPYLERLAERHNVSFGERGARGTPNFLVEMRGTRRAIRRFLLSHERSLLTVLMSCNRI